MQRLVTSILCAFVLVALSVATGSAAPPNLTGSWVLEQTGTNGTGDSSLQITQSGNQVVGKSSKGNGFSGEFVSDTQINGKWNGPGGAGWLTVYVTPNGHSFNGTWGFNGRKADGSFVANKVLPPSPVTAAGQWKVTGAGGQSAFLGVMRCTQSGKAVVCHAGSVVMNGAFKTADKVRSTWVGNGGTGWFSFWFNDDNNSFNGVWGNGDVNTPPLGRVVGQRVLQ
jgi:hypothetical protein